MNLDSGDLKQFRESLLNWFEAYRRDLPWRKNCDPYRIWISEIMLQQTRVAAVIPYYQRFLERFPNAKALAAAPQEEVLRLWSGLGYYQRARNLQRAAQQIVMIHGGVFPRTHQEILALAGIGEYTAAAILSIAFGDTNAVLDGNVARVISRLEAMRGDLGQAKLRRLLQESADRMLAQESPGSWNQAMMELGATVCTPRSPRCLQCPVAQFCEGRKQGIAESLPEKRTKRPTVSVQLVSVVLLDGKNNSLLLPPPKTLTKNKSDDHVPSLVAKLWHFPTFSASAKSPNALQQFLRSDLRLKSAGPIGTERLDRVRHTVTYRVISVGAYLVRLKRLPRLAGARHMPLDEVSSLAISNLTRKITGTAMKYLSQRKPQR